MNRVRYLDGLRGILALVVFLHHYLYVFAPSVIFGGEYREFMRTGKYTLPKLLSLTPANFIFNPLTAIMFFFVLSGFVQTYNYFQKPDLQFLQKSFIKRYFRLAVPVIVVVMMVYVFHKLHFVDKSAISQNDIYFTRKWVETQLPGNLGFFAALKHGAVDCFLMPSRYYQVLWTMPVELLSSWVVMVVLFVTHALPARRQLLIGWMLIQILVIRSTYGVAFTLGILICDLHVNSERFKRLFSRYLVRAFCLAAGLYVSTYPFVSYEGALAKSVYAPLLSIKSENHVIVCAIGVALLLCWLLHARRIQSLLHNRLLLFLGEISFMVYLVHLLMVFSVAPWLYKNLSHHLGNNTCATVTGSLTFGVVVLVSWILYRVADKPVVKYCNIFIGRLFKSNPASQSPVKNKTP
jgi:peptidoglycan/LPS O-acetylase OafA/YrhL